MCTRPMLANSLLTDSKTPFHQPDQREVAIRVDILSERGVLFFGESVRFGCFAADHECLSVVEKGKKGGQTTRLQTAGTFQCLTGSL